MTKKELLAVTFPKITENRFEVRCQTVTDGLAIAFYQMHELMVRSFLGEDTFINVVEETQKQSVRVVEDLFYRLPRCTGREEYFISDHDKTLLSQWIEGDVDYLAIVRKQRRIKEREKELQTKKRIIEDSKRADLVTRLPKGFDEWLSKQKCIFVYSKTKKDKHAKATCSYCGKSWETDHNVAEWGECPHCKAYGQFKRNCLRTYKCESYTGIYLGKNKYGEILECVRTCIVTYRSSYLIRSVQFVEGDRRLLQDASNKIYVKVGKNQYISRGKIFNRRGDLFHGYSEDGYIYPSNIKRILKNTPYEKYEVEKYAKYLAQNHIAGFIKGFCDDMKQHPLSEQVAKAGFRDAIYHMYLFSHADIVENYGRDYLRRQMQGESLASTMGLTKTQFNAIRKERNVRKKVAELAVAAYANCVQNETPMEVIETYAGYLDKLTHNAYYRVSTCIGLVLRNPHMLTIPFVNYMKKQALGNEGKFLKDYCDYYGWLKEMEYQLTKSRLRPKDFKDAHDRTEQAHHQYLEEKEAERLQKASDYMGEIKGVVEELFKIPLLNEDYEIVVPGSRQDLLNESEHLHHCVRTYTSKIFNHNCIILFIRKKSDLGTPFYTMEVTNQFGMQQCRTVGNHSYVLDENMTLVVNAYTEELRKRAMLKKFKPTLEKLQFSIAA